MDLRDVSQIGYVLRVSHRDSAGNWSAAIQVAIPPPVTDLPPPTNDTPPPVTDRLHVYVSPDLLGSGAITEVNEPLAALDQYHSALCPATEIVTPEQ